MGIVEIPLTQGLKAIVSEADAAVVRAYRWHAVKARATFYAATRPNDVGLYMHRLVMGVQGKGRDVVVDHRNFNGLDNRRENLRLCTTAENLRHRRAARQTRGIQGVCEIRQGCWTARITHDGRAIYLGAYPTEHEAGIAYLAAAIALRGGSNA